MKKIASIICLILLINSFAFDVQADEDQNMEQEQKTVAEENEAETEIGEDESQIKEENGSLENVEEESEVVGENAGIEEGALQQEPQDSSDNYVIWGTGRGITNETIQSKGNQYVAEQSKISNITLTIQQKEMIDLYCRNNGISGCNFDDLSAYAIPNAVFVKYENAWVFISEDKIYSVKSPILNAYIAANGANSLGTPVGEQYINNNCVYQAFENGNLTYTLEKTSDTLCVRRGNTYYFKYSIGSGEADRIITYGKKTDKTIVGDWDGDRTDTLCVRRGNRYYIKNSLEPGEADIIVDYGKKTDQVYVGDWDGDEIDTLCVRRGNRYYIKNSLEPGEADEIIDYGKATDSVFAGMWIREEVINEPDIEELQFNSSLGVQFNSLTSAFAGNAVNGVSFRKNAITTFIDKNGNENQICAYYDYYGTIVLAKRVNNGSWTYEWTGLKGDITDAHNTVSVAVDGNGYIHLAWGQHAGGLNYARSEEPLSLKVSMKDMIGSLENSVTYPEFYNLPDGDLFFLYRNGNAGNGNLVLNKYYAEQGVWERVQDNLISGEGERSPYWQATVDHSGKLHISWVWRETPDVSTNYNISYMVSTDSSGTEFTNSKGEIINLPVIEDTAEVICEIPPNSSLINQTSMTVDTNDMPYIVSYWRVNGVVQYNVIRFTGEQWIIYNTDIRNTDFVLSGTATQKLPCARPQILVKGAGEDASILLLFRDDERNSYASVAKLSLNGTEIVTEKMIDISNSSLGEWEPNYDVNLWNQKGEIVLLVQKEFYTRDGLEEKYRVENMYAVDISNILS